MLPDCFRFFRIASDAFRDTVRNPQDSFKFFSSTQIISDLHISFQIPSFQFFSSQVRSELAKVRLIMANYISSKKIEGGWAVLVLVKIRLILVND